MSKKNDFKEQIYGNPNWINGRINRAEFITRVILLGITCGVSIVGVGVLYAMGMTIPAVLLGVFAAWVYWRIVMAYVKRCHDLEWSGWFALPVLLEKGDLLFDNETLIVIFNVIALILSLLLVFRKGTTGANRYGKDPLTKYEEGQ